MESALFLGIHTSFMLDSRLLETLLLVQNEDRGRDGQTDLTSWITKLLTLLRATVYPRCPQCSGKGSKSRFRPHF